MDNKKIASKLKVPAKGSKIMGSEAGEIFLSLFSFGSQNTKFWSETSSQVAVVGEGGEGYEYRFFWPTNLSQLLKEKTCVLKKIRQNSDR